MEPNQGQVRNSVRESRCGIIQYICIYSVICPYVKVTGAILVVLN